MAPPDEEELQIFLTQLDQHQGRLAGLVDRVRTAHEAASELLHPEAFGAFGRSTASDCRDSQSEAIETLTTALSCAQEHHQKVGLWRDDLYTNELNIASLFATEVIENA